MVCANWKASEQPAHWRSDQSLLFSHVLTVDPGEIKREDFEQRALMHRLIYAFRLAHDIRSLFPM